MKRKLSRFFSFLLMLMLLFNSMPAMVYANDVGLNENGSIAEDTITPDSSGNEEDNNGAPTKENSESEEISEKDNEGQSEEDSQKQDPSEESTESESEVPTEESSENKSEVPESTIDAVDKYIYIDKSAFPDDDFRNYVLKNFDTNKNKMLNANEIAQVTEMDLEGCQFSNLEGIQYFTELTDLNASKMNLTELNVSGLAKLEELICSDNSNLKTLKAEGCDSLYRLECDKCSLTELEISDCVNLFSLVCSSNDLETLDVSACVALECLECDYNLLQSLDISNNVALTNLNCYSNLLEELDVSNNVALEYVICGSNKLTELNVENLSKLEILDFSSNSISEIDLSNNTVLTYLYANNNQLTELEVSMLTGLDNLDCSGNKLTSLDVSACSKLVTLHCDDNALISLSVDGCTKLEVLSCENNELSDIDVSNCSYLYSLKCTNNKLTDLNVSDCVILEWLACQDNMISDLDVSNCTYLNNLYCDNNELTSLDTSKNNKLFILTCSGNKISSLICNSNTSRLFCSDNQLTYLNVSNFKYLISLDCYNNRFQLDLKQDGENYYFDLSAFPEAFDLTKCSEWMDETTGTKLNGPDENLLLQGLTADTEVVSYRYDCGRGYSVEFYLNTEGAVFSPAEGLEINEENFPDEWFRSAVTEYDINRDGVLDDSELAAVTEMTLDWVNSTKGIEHFTSLVTLTLRGFVTDLSLQDMPNLETVDEQYSTICRISIKNCPKLKSLRMDSVYLYALEIENCPNMQYLSCENNPLIFANLTGVSLIEAKGLVNEDGSICQFPSIGIKMDENRQIDLSGIIESGFAPERTSGWDGGTLSGDILTVNEGSGEVRFFYNCGSGIVVEMVWTITDIEGLWISSVPDQLYTGSAIKPKVDVYSGNKKLVLGKDYTISYKNNVNAKDADSVDAKGKSIAPTIVIKGKGNYTGTAIKTFTINPINLDNVETDAIINSTLSIEPVVAAYTGKIVKVKPIIKLNGKTMSSSLYTLEYNDTVDGAYTEEGEYSITIKGKGTNVIGSCVTKEYISKKLISKVNISFDKTSFVYDSETGITHPGVITVKSGTTILEEGKDYFISYRNDDRIGTATVMITGNKENGWYGQKTKTYKITGKKLTSAMVKQLTKAFTYNRERQSVSSSDYEIYDGKTLLKENVDYVVTYPGPEKSYINAGSFKVTFTGIGAYTGAVTKTWKIQKISLETLCEKGYLKFYNYGEAMYTKAGGKATPDIYVDNPGYYNDYYLKEGVDYTITYVNNSKVANYDDAKAPYFFITGKGNYTGNTKKYPNKFSIIAANISSTGTILADDVLYKDKKGNFLPKLSVIDNATGKKLTKGKDYDSNILYEYAADGEDNWVTITAAERVNASTGRIKMRVTVYGKGSYSGSISDTYEVYPKSINTSSIVVSPIPSQKYTGKTITPKVTVSLKEKDGKTYKYTELTEGVDYTVEYRKNREKGTAIVFIYGKGQYGGKKKVTFKITGQPIEWWKEEFSAF